MRFAHRKFLLACFALVLLAGLAFPRIVCAEIDAATIAAAAEAFKAGKSAEALSLYEQALASAGHGAGTAQLAALNYNAGNAAFKAGKLGWALAYYSQAARLSPFDGDIAHNRRMLEAKLGRADQALPPLPKALTSDVFLDTPPDIWLVLALTALLASLTIWLLTKRAAKASAGFVLAFLSALLFCAAVHVDSVKNGVIVSDETIVRSGPGESFPEMTRIGQGSVVQVRESQAGWYKVAFEFRQKRVVGWAGAIAVHRLGE